MKSNTLNSLTDHFNQQLATSITSLTSPSTKIIEAMSYSSLSKSKRLRPLLVYATGLYLGLSVEVLDPIANAIELTHTYSLIHDDLPAMDDDDMRRGKPSNHKQFDEATAILAGDALQNLAIQMLLESPLIDDAAKNKMAVHLLRATGYHGMIAGQCLDMELLESATLSLKSLQEIHLLKTACLLDASIKLPLLMAPHIDMITKKQLNQLGTILGLAFQIQDDYLDRYGDSDKLGKQQGSDIDANKKTFADFYSQSELKALIEDYYQQAEYGLAVGQDNPQKQLLLDIISKLKNRQW